MKNVKKGSALLLALILAFSIVGCSSKRLGGYFSKSMITSIEYFNDDVTEKLDEEKLGDFVSKLNSFSLKKHYICSDYNWAGRYGIRLYYADGTVVTYDGTALIKYDGDGKIEKRVFLSCDHDFTQGINEFFDADTSEMFVYPW